MIQAVLRVECTQGLVSSSKMLLLLKNVTLVSNTVQDPIKCYSECCI